MSMLARETMAIAELLASGALGAMFGLWWARRSGPVELHDDAATMDIEREPPLVEAYLRTQACRGAIAQRAHEPAGQTRRRE